MSITLSVVIPTYNRVFYLTKVLKGLEQQSLDKSCFEIIIVDNKSTDNTKEVVLGYSTSIENLIYIYEPKQGLNYARNTGLCQARGEYIAYLDDDAVPYEHWAKKIIEVFASVKPQPGVVGGPTVPVWVGEKPTWLIPKFEPAISMINYGGESRFLQGREFLVGANMAFLKTALVSIGGFIDGLDRIGDKLLSGGDTAAIESVKKLNLGVYYHPDIAVDHYVSANRLTHKWFIKRYYWGGYSEALMWYKLSKPNYRLRLKKIGFYLYGFIRNPAHLAYPFYTPANPQKFWFKCIVHARIGYLYSLFNHIAKN
ncbi:glycosyltransferase [Rhodocytophaga aerolata]|uniref:Glycosyltransferase n=1 Tax=Rhodocytophaga aerolata TaxID=455078 RepID=A0ABT8RGB5_9BACT|nr:glycosyltransferase [Rhodocytophaga aerolata]MDO1451024.1 glycosyltransferase [Rhodocytophaga aerolata]